MSRSPLERSRSEPKEDDLTQACDSCRRQKIKCDEKVPCSQCVIYKRECTRLTGTILVLTAKDYEKKKSSGAGKRAGGQFEFVEERIRQNLSTPSREKLSKSPPKLQFRNQTVLNSRAKKQRDTQVKENRRCSASPTEKTAAPKLPGSINITEVVAKQLTSRWHDVYLSFGSRITGLSPMVPGHQTERTERALIATSLAYHGRVSRDQTAMMQSYRVYGDCLQTQRNYMDLTRKRNKKATLEDVCDLIALFCYEDVSNTSPSGAFWHIVAAENLLATVGPEACRQGLFYRVFRILRSEGILIHMKTRTPSVFAQKDWMTIPFLDQPRLTSHRLADVFLLLPALLAGFDNLGAFPTSAEIVAITSMGTTLLAELDSISAAFNSEFHWPRLGKRNSTNPYDFYWEDRGDEPKLEATANLLLAWKAMAQIHCLSVLTQLQPESSDMHDQRLLHISSQIIFQAEALAAIAKDGRWATAIEPLRVVHLVSPDLKQRARAKEMLGDFSKGDDLEAIFCRNVFDTLRFGATPAARWNVMDPI